MVFQVSLVELLRARWRDRGARLQILKEEVSSPEYVYPRQVHAYLTQVRGGRIPPPEVREPVCRPPEVSLFSGLPLGLCDSLYEDLLRPDIVGVRLLRWEADLVFPFWLSAWARWHAALPPLLSGARDEELWAHLCRVDTEPFARCPPTRVDGGQQGSMKWHEDFLLRDRAQVYSIWPGDVVQFCGSTFNWARVLPLLEFVNASAAVHLDDALQRAQGGAG